MKKSPHRHEHQRKKSIRKASQDLLNQNNKENASSHHPKESFSHIETSKEHLSPFDVEKTKEMFEHFKKHLEHVRFEENPTHKSKRTTPGEVKEEKSYTNQGHNPQAMRKKWTMKKIENRHSLARKTAKIHNEHFKKAA